MIDYKEVKEIIEGFERVSKISDIILLSKDGNIRRIEIE